MAELSDIEKQEPKRLNLSDVTIKRLFALSGNQCAFPGCTSKLVDDDSFIYGEICHIEAAMPGGERFNEKQTNEERSRFDNLILLCRNHHITTNNVNKYTPEILKKMKKDHESKFLSTPYNVQDSVIEKSIEQYNSSYMQIVNGNHVNTGPGNQTISYNLNQGMTQSEVLKLITDQFERFTPKVQQIARDEIVNHKDTSLTQKDSQIPIETQTHVQLTAPVSTISTTLNINPSDQIITVLRMIIEKSVKKGDTVTVNYIGLFENGTVFDTSDATIAEKAGIFSSTNQYTPISFIVGTGSVINGFDNAVIGMSIGDIKTIKLTPDQAYGEYNPSLIQPVPLKVLKDANIMPELNQTLYYNLQPVRVDKIIPNLADPDNTLVHVDFNHPMAGKILHFRVSVINIESAN